MKKVAWSCMLLACLSLGLTTDARPASAPTSERAAFEGKTIRIIVGVPPGGFFDLWSRLLARHMGRYIPGNPKILVQNMPGAGSMFAANYLYGVAKPDGLTFGTVLGPLYLNQLAGAPGVAFNWSEFTFLGRTTGDSGMLYMRADLPTKNWRDLRAAAEPIPVGTTGTGSTDYILAQVMSEVLGFNLKMVMGYPGGAAIDTAVERGEVAARAMGISPFVGREPFLTWRKKGFVRAIVQTGRERDPRLEPDVPTVWEIAKELQVPRADLEFMETAFKWGEWYWSFMAPPRLPTERAKILRSAFHKALHDSRLVEEGAKIGLFPDPIDAEKLQQMAAEVVKIDAKTVARIKKLMGD